MRYSRALPLRLSWSPREQAPAPSAPARGTDLSRVRLASPASRHLACRFPWRGCVYRPEPHWLHVVLGKPCPPDLGASQSPHSQGVASARRGKVLGFTYTTRNM